MKFICFLLIKLGGKKVIFNARQGVAKTKHFDGKSRMKVSIKDPFINEINYGVDLIRAENFDYFLTQLHSFYVAALSSEDLKTFFRDIV